MKSFINKIKGFSKKDFVKVFSLAAVSSFIKILSSFVSIKVVSVIIGPSGLALLGQLTNFNNIFLRIATGGNNTGVTKYLASSNGDEQKNKEIIGTSLFISFYLSLICGIILILFSGYFSALILNDIGQQKYKSIFVVFGITILLYALNTKLLAILNGFKEYRKYILVDIISSTVGLIFSVFLVFYWNIYGALLAAVTFQSVVFLISIFLVTNASWFKKDFLFSGYNKIIAKKLTLYSIMALTSAICVPLSQMIIRSKISADFSVNDAGIWEGINKISVLNLMIITKSLGIYYLPKLSSIKDDFKIKNEIIKTAKLLIPLVIFTSLTIYLLRDFIIQLIFTESFKEMRELFSYQLLGDFCKILSWLFAYLILAKSMTKTYVFLEIFSCFSWVLLSFLLMNFFGYKGATIAYFLNYVIYLIFMIILFRKILFNKKAAL